MAIIDWAKNGWTTVQEADAVKHILEITCLAENGVIIEVRKRHNDGEEEIFKDKLDDENTLPMPLKDFKKFVKNWKK